MKCDVCRLLPARGACVTIAGGMPSKNRLRISSVQERRILVWLPAVAWAALIYFISAQPKEAFERLGLPSLLVFVGGHLVVYFVLMVLLVVALRYSSSLSPNHVYMVAFLLIVLYGLSDEYHQSFVPGRTATIVDWLVDLIGAGAAWIILVRWEHRRKAAGR